MKEKLIEYQEKQKSTSYTNKGEISANITGTEEESLEILNKSKITFEGKTNTNNKLTEQNITLDFGQGFNIPIKFKSDGDMYGIQSDFIDSKFITIRNENLKDLFAKFNIQTEGIPDKIDVKNQKFTKQELKSLKERYLKILNDNLEKELFTKEKEEKQTIITLSMTEGKFIEIVTKILEEVRNDEILLSRISNKDELVEQIDEMVSDLKTMRPSQSNMFEMRIYIEGRKAKKYEINLLENSKSTLYISIENKENKVIIKMNDETTEVLEMNISKEDNQDDVSYKVQISVNSDTNEMINLEIVAQYKNIMALDNVEEIYNINISFKDNEQGEDSYFTSIGKNMEMSLNYSNQKTFNSDIQIERLNENNAIILNDATNEEIQAIIMGVYQKMGLI